MTTRIRTHVSGTTDDKEILSKIDLPVQLLDKSPQNSHEDEAGLVKSKSDVELNDDGDDLGLVETDRSMILTMIGLIFMVASLSSLDRVAMSVAIVPMSAEMGLSDADKGSISSFFSVGYGLGIVPAGLALSTLSPRIIMACGIALWSVGTILTPLAAVSDVSTSAVDSHHHDMKLLWIARAVVGAAESVVVPTIQRLLSSWIPPARKSLAVATVFCGFQLGTILAYSLSPTVIETSGGDWRSVFYVYGGAGLLFLVPWLLLSQDAPPQLSVTSHIKVDEVNNKTEDGIDEVSSNTRLQATIAMLKSAPWEDLVRSKATWAMFLAHAGE